MCQHHHHDSGKRHCCGKCGGHCGCHSLALTEREQAFIRCLKQLPFLPVAQFILHSTKSEHLEAVALAPVYILDAEDTIEHIKETGALLRELEEKGLITLDYEVPLQDFDYQVYYESAVYQSFLQTVTEAKKKTDFLYNIGIMELGSMALTQYGYEIADQLKDSASIA